jgi:hypothetical protein
MEFVQNLAAKDTAIATVIRIIATTTAAATTATVVQYHYHQQLKPLQYAMLG